MALNDRIVFRIALAAMLAGTLALSACGRKGALEAPPYASVSPDPAAAKDSNEGKPHPKPDRPFLLDPLI